MSHPRPSAPARGDGLTRRILALAIPALGALIVEPLLLLADTVIIGRLGTDPLAGTALAGAVVQTAVGLMVFLAYSTTPAVARAVGAGRLPEALAHGRDGLWAGAGIGLLLALAGAAAGVPLLRALGGQGAVLEQASAYLLWSLPGLPAILLVTAGVGVLRGLQDTVTPLVVAAAAAVLNVGLSLGLVYGAGMGVAGAALGTSLTQWAMAAAYLLLIARRARAHGVGPWTTPARLAGLLSVGSWLMLRTLSLRAALLLTVVAATAQGTRELAAYQLIMTVFNVMAYALDALAIAAQALVGKEAGAQPLRADGGAGARARAEVRRLVRRIVVFGLWSGVLTGLLVGLAGPLAAPLLTPDPQVQRLFAIGMVVVGLAQPLAAWVFVLDGVLIGAGDARYLALAGVINLVVYLPLLGAVALSGAAGAAGVVALWAAYAVGYMGARGVTLGARARGDDWLLAA